MTADPVCSEAGDDVRHQKRPAPFPGPRCYSCHHARRRTRRRARRLKQVERIYGLGPGELEAVHAYQRGTCPGCGRPIRLRSPVDHNHATGQVRGQLCDPCNRYLGYIGDDPAKLIRFALYVVDPPAPHVVNTLDHK